MKPKRLIVMLGVCCLVTIVLVFYWNCFNVPTVRLEPATKSDIEPTSINDFIFFGSISGFFIPFAH